MARPYQILIPLLSLFLVRVDLTDLHPLKIPVRLLRVYDGDTVLLGHQHYRFKLRFSKIDSPELKQPFIGKSESAGEFSKKCLQSILQTQSKFFLRLEGFDLYGRILGDLNNLSLRLIEMGCTTLYPHAQFASKHEKFTYLRALKNAKAQRVGLWQYGGFVQPKIWRKLSKRGAVRRWRR
jgi:endonuclease YncB( thermonuclease family)